MGLKESGLRGSLRNVSTDIPAIPDSAVSQWDAQSLDLPDGETVDPWPDKIGNNDATLVSSGVTYQADEINGHPAVRFSGGHLDSGIDPNSDNHISIIAVWRVESETDAAAFRARGDEELGLSTLESAERLNFNHGDVSELSSADYVNDNMIQTGHADFGTGRLRRDGSGVSTFSYNTVGPTNSTAFIGERPDGSSHQLPGVIGELMIYEGASSSEIESEEQRLSDKWDIPLD